MYTDRGADAVAQFHRPAAVLKMASGQALTDADR